MGALFAALLLAALPACSSAVPSAERGAKEYVEHCAVCHGDVGDGKGIAAARFSIAPRDFTKGLYKYRSTPSGQLPLDGDLVKLVTRGIPGTAMVPQGDVLDDDEIRDVVAYLKTLSPRFASAAAPPKQAEVPELRPATRDSIAKGRKAFEDNGCPVCHGREGRGDGSSAGDLSVKPPDLTKLPRRSGTEPSALLRVIVTGLDGSPMPSFGSDIPAAELSDLVHFLVSLSAGAKPEMTADEQAGWDAEERKPPKH